MLAISFLGAASGRWSGGGVVTAVILLVGGASLIAMARGSEDESES